MANAHLTTAPERVLGAEEGFAAVRRPRELQKGGAGNAESSSALVADPDRARARFAGRDGLGPIGSTTRGERARPALVPTSRIARLKA